MIPEIEITCREKKHFIHSITVKQYKKYVGLMKKNNSEKRKDVLFFNKKIIQEVFQNEISLEELGETETVEFLVAAKTIHFVMQDGITEKMINLIEAEKVEWEKSAFDEYDIENEYEEEAEENQWHVCGEIIDRVIKIAIRLLKNSYSLCMKEDILELLEYLKFELSTIDEN